MIRARRRLNNWWQYQQSDAHVLLWKEFQPRIGFAWDITGTGKHVLRGGYGIARDQIFQNLTLWSIQQSQPTIYQAVFDQARTSPPNVPDSPARLPAGSPVIFATSASASTRFRQRLRATTDLAFGSHPWITSPTITDPWSQQFSIGYAWQINQDYAFSADYIHILGTHEERVLNQNPTIKRFAIRPMAATSPIRLCERDRHAPHGLRLCTDWGRGRSLQPDSSTMTPTIGRSTTGSTCNSRSA